MLLECIKLLYEECVVLPWMGFNGLSPRSFDDDIHGQQIAWSISQLVSRSLGEGCTGYDFSIYLINPLKQSMLNNAMY